MAVGRIEGRRRGKREEGGTLSKHEIDDSAMCAENERTDTGRDGRTRLATLNSQVRTGAEKKIIPVQLTTIRVGSHSG